MKISLPLNTFSFFKVVSGLFFLITSLIFPLAIYWSMIAAVFSRPHGLGAYFSMWRAGKLNWLFAIWILSISVAVSYWSIQIASLSVLGLVTYLLFCFHFIYDEFVLQEEQKIFSNLVSASAPLILTVLFLLNDFFKLHIMQSSFLGIAIFAFLLELIYLSEINWFFVQTKLLTLFILISVFLQISPYAVINVFFISHYFFWFIYPVYKLHKYKRAERDGLIIVLLILAVSSLYSSTTSVTASQFANVAIFTRLFLAATIIHILTTAPFAYVMGMPRTSLARPLSKNP